jgi:peptidoglycan/LPS O-acetylase OafA/YrhL
LQFDKPTLSWLRCAPPVALTGRLHFLDALRGLAALAVMLFHFFALGVSPVHDRLAAGMPLWIAWLFQHLYCGVEVFFVLSGFVIAFSMDGHTANLRYAGNFIVRRSLRLDPPYWVACALMLGYFLCRWPTRWHDFYLMYGGIKGLAANLFYVQNLSFIHPAHSILDVSWTLCLEIQFYLAYLVMLLLGYYVSTLAARRATVVLRVIVVLGVAGVGGWSFWHSLQRASPDFAGRAWNFFLAVALYGALTRRVPKLAAVIPLTALAALFFWRKEIPNIVTIATAAAIYIAGATGRLSTLLSWRPLLHFGKISYSLYLLHMVIGLNLLWLLKPVKAGSAVVAWISVALAVVLSLLGAELLYRLVEAPSNRLSQRLKRRRPVAATLPTD